MASNAIDVYVKHPSGRNAQYNILPSQQIAHLCDLVAKEEGIPKEHIRLKYQGKTLTKTQTAGWYGVRVETILKAEILVPSRLELAVEILSADSDGEHSQAEVAISNLDPVSELYGRVAELMEVTKTRVNLQISGRTLPSSSTALMDAGVTAETKLTACLKKETSTSAKKAKEDEKISEEALQTILSSFDSNGKRVEVVFSFDTTGSMHSYLTTVRTKLRECVTRLLQEIPGIRIGMVAHGDYCDDNENSYVLRQVDLTTDVDVLVNFAENAPLTSGGDAPECYELVLQKAQLLDWSEDSAKALVVIGDLYPHAPSYTDQGIYWRSELDILTGMGVKVYGVRAGYNDEALKFYKELSIVSGGCYIKLEHIDAITDMFLAVCYRESDDAMLGEFEQEVESAGQMTDAKRTMFSHLKKKTTNVSEPEESSLSSPSASSSLSHGPGWWNAEHDHGVAEYNYDTQKDKWIKVSVPIQNREISVSRSPNREIPVSRHKKKGRCVVM